MKTNNCLKCDKDISNSSDIICSDCKMLEDSDFLLVKEYIRKNPHNNLQQITSSTGVEGYKILSYIKDGKITVSKGLSSVLRCEHCDKPITSGKYCDKCSSSPNSNKKHSKLHSDFGSKIRK